MKDYAKEKEKEFVCVCVRERWEREKACVRETESERNKKHSVLSSRIVGTWWVTERETDKIERERSGQQPVSQQCPWTGAMIYSTTFNPYYDISPPHREGRRRGERRDCYSTRTSQPSNTASSRLGEG